MRTRRVTETGKMAARAAGLLILVLVLVPNASAVTLNPGARGIIFELADNAVINWQVAMNVDRIQVGSDTLSFTVGNRLDSLQVVTDSQISMTVTEWCPICAEGVIIAWDAAAAVAPNPSTFRLSIPTYPLASYRILLDGEVWNESRADDRGGLGFEYAFPSSPHSFEIERVSAGDGGFLTPFTIISSYEFVSEDIVRFGATTAPLGNYTYLWEFGDGQVSSDPNPSHRYQYGFSAMFDVRLTTCSEEMCAIVTQQVPLLRWTYLAGLIGIAGLIAVYNLVTIRRARVPPRLPRVEVEVVRDLESLETLMMIEDPGEKGR